MSYTTVCKIGKVRQKPMRLLFQIIKYLYKDTYGYIYRRHRRNNLDCDVPSDVSDWDDYKLNKYIFVLLSQIKDGQINSLSSEEYEFIVLSVLSI